jgi:glutamate/aspartate transport system substrate-binding protein
MPTTSVLDDIYRRGVVRIGFQRHTPPFSYATGSGFTPIGYSVDLARHVVAGIARRATMALKIQAVEVTSSTREAMLQSGEVDLECGSTTITDERSLRMVFSRPIFHTAHRVAVKVGHPRIAGAGLCITGINGSTSHFALQQNADAFASMSFSGYRSIGEAFDAFQKKSWIDAIVADEVILAALLRQPPILDARLLDVRLGGEYYGFMMRQGDPEFAVAVNHEIDLALGSASFQTLHSAWFSCALPGLEFDLGMTISDELQRIR